jgi:hypothetical protein
MINNTVVTVESDLRRVGVFGGSFGNAIGDPPPQDGGPPATPTTWVSPKTCSGSIRVPSTVTADRAGSVKAGAGSRVPFRFQTPT